MIKMIAILLFIICIIVVLFRHSYADTLVLKNGKRIKGVVTYESSDRCVIDIYLGGGIVTETHKKIDVKEVIRDADENSAIFEQHRNAVKALRLEEERRRKQEKDALVETKSDIRRKLLELYKKSKRDMEKAKIRQEKLNREWKETIDTVRERQKAAEEKAEKERLEEERKKKEQEAEDKAYEFAPVTTYITQESQHTNPVKHYRSDFINTGNWTKKHVMITVSFYDWQGKLLARKVVYTVPESVEPGEKGKFEVSLDATIRASDYKISAFWVY